MLSHCHSPSEADQRESSPVGVVVLGHGGGCVGGWLLLVRSGLVRMEHGEEPKGLPGGAFHNPTDCLPPDSSLNGILIQPNRAE